jgi:hypothetical protein
MEKTLKTFRHPDGKRRVLIVQRSNGLFGYELEELAYIYDGELREQCPDTFWTRPSQNPFSLCDTPETAEREALGAIEWLREIL